MCRNKTDDAHLCFDFERSFPMIGAFPLSQINNSKNRFYFTTRDLLIVAVMAALGGVTSTYINALSDVVHAFLGFPGGSQWAAGLHVIWIVLAMGMIQKPGAGIIAGLLKGAVELMSGNSHGVIILLINLVAGLLVDFGFLIFTKKRSLLPYLLAGGLASGSNVLVFQLFATLPQNILGLTAIFILFFVALVSGVIFAGLIPYQLLITLEKANVIKVKEKPQHNKKHVWLILLGVLILAALFAVFLRISNQGSPTIQVLGAVDSSWEFPSEENTIDIVTRKMDYRGVMTEYSGYPLLEIVQFANPHQDADTLLIEASDGYAFLISFEELQNNENILLVKQGRGKDASFDVVGPASSKAWIRKVDNLTIIAANQLTIRDASQKTHDFLPDEWTAVMDSTQINLDSGSEKLQGVAVWRVVEKFSAGKSPSEVIFSSPETTLSLPWAEIEGNDNLRIFTRIEGERISYLLARMSGEVLITPLSAIEIN